MRQTVHLFIGEEMAPVAEAVSRHILSHGSNGIGENAKVLKLISENGTYKVRSINFETIDNQDITNETEGKAFFSNVHNKLVLADRATTAELYLCIYCQLYSQNIASEIEKISHWISICDKQYRIDVWGLTHDLAHLFCISKADERALISKADSLYIETQENLSRLIQIEKSDNSKIERLIINQNCNQKGYGLNLDKTTLIRIFGEYAILTTEQFDDIYPIANLNRPDITALGISALWFDKSFFNNNLLARCYIYVLEREKVRQHTIDDPMVLLKKANDYIDPNKGLLSEFFYNSIRPLATVGANEKTLRQEVADNFNTKLDELEHHFLSVIDDVNLSLPEKRALFALFLMEDDELFDSCALINDLPALDDCFEESVLLYLDEWNKMTGESREFPLPRLKRLKSDIRMSEGFIRDSKKRLKEIEQNIKFEDDCKKKLTKEGFSFGETTYQLLHEIVEKPLADTYIPKGTSLKSVDLRKDFSGIRNQGTIGSCTAFSTSSLFEYILNRADKSCSHRLSPRFLYYNVCKKNADGTPQDKGSSYYDNISSLGTMGICEEKYCRYNVTDFQIPPSEEAKSDAASRLVTEAKNVDRNHTAITSALAEGYPIGISLKIFNSFSNGRKGFVFRPSVSELQCSDYGYHAMVICGYIEDKKVYIVRNSWGESFGDKGYCYIPFSYIEDPDLCRQACIITGVSCNEIKAIDEENQIIDFDSSSKEIEYAILKILIDEEEIRLDKLRCDFETLKTDYIRLISELCNKGKRREIAAHALDQINAPQATEITKSEKYEVPKYEMSKWVVLVGSLLLAFIVHDIPTLSIFVTIIGIIAFFLMKFQKETKLREVKKEVSPSPDSLNPKLATELKFLAAGMAIDRIKKIKDQIEAKHRLLSSYISHLSSWLIMEKTYLEQMEDDVRVPFISILSEDDFNQFFDNAKDEITGEIWLYKEFQDYHPEEEVIQKFKHSIKDKIQKKISSYDRNFSMFNFLTGTEHYWFDGVASSNVNKWMKQIEKLSLSFVENCVGCPSLTPRRLLLIKCKNKEEKDQWFQFCQDKYASLPILAYAESPFKLTYFQIQDMSSDEIKILKEKKQQS